MSWADKALRKAKLQKEIDRALQSPEYKKMEQESKQQMVLQAYIRFCLMACDYLQIRHGYKKNGILNFLKYASDILKFISFEDEKYFEDMNQVMIDECGIDVLEVLGMKILKGK